MFTSSPGTPLVLPPALAIATASDAERPDRAALSSDPALFADLLDLLLSKSGLTQAEVARRLAQAPQSIHQYRSRVRPNPSLKWFLRFVHVCGAKVVIELPSESL